MLIKRLVKRIPFAVRAHRRYTTLVRGFANSKIFKQLENTPYAQGVQIAKALKSLMRKVPQPDRDWIERIEVERKRLQNCREPLIDGSLGEGGLYDKGLTIQQACAASKSPKQALLLFLLARFMRPSNIIELGTNVGISSAYIAAGLMLNGKNCTIATLDASPYRQRLAKEVHCNLAVDNISYVEGLFKDTLGTSLVALGSIDFAFIDGHHQYQPTLDYFEEILKFSAPNAVFVFDDIRWSEGMKKAWSQIQSDDRLGLIVNLCSVGVCVRRQEEISQRFNFGPIDAL
jgi:predicted O-methyltransferase YrrM